MNAALPFRDLSPAAPRVRVTLDGAPLDLPDGANLAAALLAAGVGSFRATPVSGAPRGPFCMMGACFDCLIEVGGVTRQACMMQVSAGLLLTRPKGRAAE
ncbi:MAG: (2Fe-2S)-binding protein [Rhodobacterales bacterium]|nr:(2Fe-2S)-binding protein [Rhodobacterales bacterium]MDX5391704.1 (2Fe-2S)-binding protein [Rhodobacterales bacterium]MDX5491404.1 (2Fe-2S)-binding protein [Rhodobacterales bacterium]